MALSGPQKTVAQTVGVVVLMGSLAWASVPFYDWFCRVTGFGGTTGVAEAAPEDILDRTVTVRFDASKAKDMAWEFKPVVREMEMRIGETGLAFYEAYNPTDRPIAGQASYNVAPYSAGGYFQKIACFCFEEQVLQPGERVEMPVTFFVDPEIVDDPEAQYVHTITLSYTFYEIDLPEGYAALEAQAETNTN
ncbi:cytochrome c oxidase assembly protein [Ruegeria marisrubri]|uniref:cytochrome c oxidase assembly protein n=1 Tax=Ruegeria marisrubri TaxID=1685379 RepID=UPI001CD209F1|nr:cytochrome c oxidase assembly protein [Ruegeria marisrubri]MCA0907517.1 cytochrome c oxidase assembly protein [Ruegeria marisrubri]